MVLTVSTEVSVSFIASAIGTKVAIAAVALVALGGGTAAAAAAGVLPTPGHTFVHNDSETTDPTESASPDPSDSPDPSSSATPVGPDATGPAAFGLCTAYTAGGLSTHSIAFGALQSASTDGDIAAYCATVLAAHPGQAGQHGPGNIPAPHHTGAPSDHSTSGKPDDAGSHGR